MTTILSLYKEVCSKYNLEQKHLGTESYKQLDELCKSLKLEVDVSGKTNNQVIVRLCKTLLSADNIDAGIQKTNNNVASTAQTRAKVLSNYFNKKDK